MKRLLLCIFLSLMIAGCATSPKEALTEGCGPLPENYAEMIHCYLDFKLDDPASLKDFKVIKPPEKIKVDTFYSSIPLDEGGEVWQCLIVYDAKNSTGKYVGKDLHVVWFRDSKIVQYDYKPIELEFRIKQRTGDPCA